jgi:hypothetical protein
VRVPALTLCLLLSLAACGGGGGGGGGAAPTPAPSPAPAPAPAPVPDPVVKPSASSNRVYAGEYVQFTAGDPQAGVTWRWEFSDGGQAEGRLVERRLAQAGSYTATAVGQNSAGVAVRASSTVQVDGAAAVLARANGALVPGCSGLHCAVEADGRYAGPGAGVGVWRYRNSAASARSIDLDLANVQAGQSVTLIFSNGETADATEVPGTGTVAAALAAVEPRARAQLATVATTTADARLARDDTAHAHRLDESRRQWLDDLRDAARAATGQPAAELQTRSRALAATTIGSTRVWNDLFDDPAKPVPFTATAQSSCAAGKRRLVFWIDQKLSDARTVQAAQLEPLRNSFCGDQGGFARTTALLGDVWGSTEVAARPWLIQETGTDLQDVHIVVTDQMGADGGVAGYFYGLNNSLRTRSSRYVNSNEALAFFINGTGLARDPTFYASTLVHELTHMVNYHQRSIRRGTSHDSWLEETSAMATEDLLADTITPGANKIIRSRMPSYLRSGGGVAMVDWASSSDSANYGVGGSLAAFLNRRYGSAWAQQIVTGCDGVTSYGCLDTVLRRLGSEGLPDEWERMGTSLFGGMPQRHAPAGYGLPQTQTDGFWLMGGDTVELADTRKSAPVKSLTRLGRTSHTYLDDQVPAGATRYQRRGVMVPAGVVLTVVVR